MAAAAHYLVHLRWLDNSNLDNPFSSSAMSEDLSHVSKCYTRKQAWEYVKAARRHADENSDVKLYDVVVLDCLTGEPVWMWSTDVELVHE